jgi:transcriptional regulator with XRE-family HTH domain
MSPLRSVSPLERLRAQAGLSVAAACDGAQLNRRTLAFLERGVHVPQMPTVHRLARLYEVDAGELLEEIRRYVDEQRVAA